MTLSPLVRNSPDCAFNMVGGEHSPMELFSRRRRTTGSAQQSNMYGMTPCIIFVLFDMKTTAYSLSPTTKGLHGSGFEPGTSEMRIS